MERELIYPIFFFVFSYTVALFVDIFQKMHLAPNLKSVMLFFARDHQNKPKTKIDLIYFSKFYTIFGEQCYTVWLFYIFFTKINILFLNLL